MPMNEKKKDEFFKLCKAKLESAKISVKGRDDVSFPSKLKHIDDVTLEFTMGRVHGMVPDVNVHDILDVAGTLTTGQQIMFYCKVRRMNISDNPQHPSILICQWPDDFAKKQLRQDVRVKCALKTYYSDALNENHCIPEDNMHQGVLADISRGGGFMLTKGKVYFRNSDIYLFLYINDNNIKIETIIPCKVVVLKELGSREPKVQGMALTFTNLSKDTENALVDWLFAQQRIQAANQRHTR